jgi:hypothetical protein
MAEEEMDITQTKLFGEGMMTKKEWYIIREMSRRAIIEAVMNIRYVDTWALVEIIERDLMPDARAVVFGMDMKVEMGGFIGKLEELPDGMLVVKDYKVQELSVIDTGTAQPLSTERLKRTLGDNYAMGIQKRSKRKRMVLWLKVLWKKHFSRKEKRDRTSLLQQKEEVKKMNWKMLPIKGYWKTRNMVKKLWIFTKNIQLRKSKETFTVVVWNEDHGEADGMVWKDVIKAKRVNNTQLLIQTLHRKIYLPMFNMKRYEIISKEDDEFDIQ